MNRASQALRHFTPLTTIRAPEVMANPYPYYARLREGAPIVLDPLGSWVVSRYEDVSKLLHHPAAASDRMRAICQLRSDGRDPEIVELFETLRRFFVFLDAPQHTRLRGLVSKAFTPRRVQEMRARIARRVDALLDRALDKSEFDVMSELAVPLPVAVICDMLDVPAEDGPRLKRWSSDVASMIGASLTMPHGETLRIAHSAREYMEYFRGKAEQRRREPGDDLLSALVQVQSDGDALDTLDISATAALLIFAGHETTTNLIGNGLLALSRDGAALARLRREPALWPSAIDELLRYDSPVQLVSRTLREDVVIAGERIAANQVVYLMIGAANRDPDRFEQPDKLQLARPNNRHLSFGHGPHFCIGAALARLEAELALRGMLQRCGDIEPLHAGLARRANPAFRGLERFPIAVRATSRELRAL